MQQSCSWAWVVGKTWADGMWGDVNEKKKLRCAEKQSENPWKKDYKKMSALLNWNYGDHKILQVDPLHTFQHILQKLHCTGFSDRFLAIYIFIRVLVPAIKWAIRKFLNGSERQITATNFVRFHCLEKRVESEL